MNLSWSQNLFIKINNSIGQHTWLDKLMKFSAHWLIYFNFFAIIVWGMVVLTPLEFKLFIKLLLTAITLGNVISWVLAFVWHHPRPIEELPEVKELVIPLQTFRSFPSLHTMMSFMCLFIAILSGASLLISAVFFIICIIIATSRVYVGVHYPRDIFGGILFALIFSLLSFWLLESISQPAYVWLVNFIN